MNKLVAALERIVRLDTKVVEGGYIVGDYADIAMEALSEHRAEPSADVVRAKFEKQASDQASFDLGWNAAIAAMQGEG